MSDIPDDIFTEPAQVDPDTLANLGPLRRLAGVWEGRKGVDLNPKANGPERKEFVERIELQPIDYQLNGPQLFYGLRYHTHILATDEDATFHEQVGYWLWEPATGLVLQTLAIPRGQTAMAAGHAMPDATSLVLAARRGDTEYGICSTAFLEQAFRTDSYRIEVTFNPDGSWSYVQETMLLVRGRTEPFQHRDVNTLTRVGHNFCLRLYSSEKISKSTRKRRWMKHIVAATNVSISVATDVRTDTKRWLPVPSKGKH